jgi:hypothetical protein
MKLTDNLGLLLLGIWLIATGLLPLINLNIPALGLILGILAIAAGVLIILRPAKVSRNIGVILLSVWLIATGLLPILNLVIPAIVLSLVAIVAGILILLGR